MFTDAFNRLNWLITYAFVLGLLTGSLGVIGYMYLHLFQVLPFWLSASVIGGSVLLALAQGWPRKRIYLLRKVLRTTALSLLLWPALGSVVYYILLSTSSPITQLPASGVVFLLGSVPGILAGISLTYFPAYTLRLQRRAYYQLRRLGLK
jgi:predicted secreted protein